MILVKVPKKNYKKIVDEAIKHIQKGRVMVYPTDTVYGLICDATNKKAIARLFKIKSRPEGKPIPVFVKNIKMVKKLAEINATQEKFLKKVWPGKVTVILKRKNKLPKILFGTEKTIGLRIPNYKLLNLLLKEINKPLTGTSANISGEPASGNIRYVVSQFKKQKYQPDLVVDAENLKKAKPSTVVDLTGPKPKILRKGSTKIPKKFN